MHMGTNRSSYRHSRAVFAVLSECTFIFPDVSTNSSTHYEYIHDDTEIQIVDIVPRVRYVQCGSGLRWWEKRLTRLKFTIFPQWDTLTVGERVSHGEE